MIGVKSRIPGSLPDVERLAQVTRRYILSEPPRPQCDREGQSHQTDDESQGECPHKRRAEAQMQESNPADEHDKPTSQEGTLLERGKVDGGRDPGRYGKTDHKKDRGRKPQSDPETPPPGREGSGLGCCELNQGDQDCRKGKR